MKTLKVFFAGRVDPFSKFLHPFWREEMCWTLNTTLKNYQVVDASLISERNKYLSENNLAVSLVFAQSCFNIKNSDLLVVNLTDDISIGGSQEIFIAHQMGIPVIGLSPRGGKFNRLKRELGGSVYWNFKEPFVHQPCDIVVDNVEELTEAIDNYHDVPKVGLKPFNEAIEYYQRTTSAFDYTINDSLSFASTRHTSKNKLRVYFSGKMDEASGFEGQDWRQYFTDLINENSQFEAVNLDFVKPSHQYVNEGNAQLTFGRDLYLIRAADAVVVNLSDNISIGGSIEMMVAKLFHRPLIGLARREGKFVSSSRDVLGRTVKNYINPFVAATCDQLVFEAEDLPKAIDNLYNLPVKTNRIITDCANWYEANHLRRDIAAKKIFAV